MPGIESRRSRKLRESVHINGIQTHVLKEISTPGSDGTIPLLNFLENTNNFVLRTNELQLNERIYNLETKVNLQKHMLDELHNLLNDFEQMLGTNKSTTEIDEPDLTSNKSVLSSSESIKSKLSSDMKTPFNIEGDIKNYLYTNLEKLRMISMNIPNSKPIIIDSDIQSISETTSITGVKSIITENKSVIEPQPLIEKDNQMDNVDEDAIYEDVSVYNQSIADDITAVSDITRTTFANHSVYNSSPSSVHLEILRSIEEISESNSKTSDLLSIENEESTELTSQIQFKYEKEPFDKIYTEMESSIQNLLSNTLSLYITEHDDNWKYTKDETFDLLSHMIIDSENLTKYGKILDATGLLKTTETKCIEIINKSMETSDSNLSIKKIELLNLLYTISLTAEDKVVELRHMLNESLASIAENEYNTVAHINLEQIKKSLLKSIETITNVINDFLFKINELKQIAENTINTQIETAISKRQKEVDELINEIKEKIQLSESNIQFDNSITISDMASTIFKSEEIIKSSEVISINLIKSEYLVGQNIIQEYKLNAYNRLRDGYLQLSNLTTIEEKTLLFNSTNIEVNGIIQEAIIKLNEYFENVNDFITSIVKSETQTAQGLIKEVVNQSKDRSILQNWGIITTEAVLKKWEDSVIINVRNEAAKIKDALLTTLNYSIEEIKQYPQKSIDSVDSLLTTINKTIGDTITIRNKMEQRYSELSKFIIQNMSMEKENIVKHLTNNIDFLLNLLSESIMKEDIELDESNINDYALSLMKRGKNVETLPDDISTYIEVKRVEYENQIDTQLENQFDDIKTIDIYNTTLDYISEKSFYITNVSTNSLSDVDSSALLSVVSKFNKCSTDIAITQYKVDRNMIKIIKVIKLLMKDAEKFATSILKETIIKYSDHVKNGNVVDADSTLQDGKAISRNIFDEYNKCLLEILEQVMIDLNQVLNNDIDSVIENFELSIKNINEIFQQNKYPLDNIKNVEQNAQIQMASNIKNMKDGFDSKSGLVNSIYKKIRAYNEQVYNAELFETIKLTLCKK